jgi:aldose 1-epimerase
MLQSLVMPDRHGALADVELAYPTMAGYLAKPQHFGATVGRYANRIAAGVFSLDGHAYALTKNEGPNALHGGPHGFDAQLWTITSVQSGPTAKVTLELTSPDGQEGYPGNLHVSITYALDERGDLTLTYSATTDKPTVVNLTNHSLFNLAGAASGRGVLDEQLTIAADRYTPVDATLIPTGELRTVAGSPFDFRTAHVIGERVRDASDPQIVLGPGYDHNFVLNAGETPKPHFAVRLVDPVSGRTLELWTTEPGVQVYTGNFLNGSVVGVGHTLYRQGDGLALEPQHFPDSPNHPAFPSTRLDPGQTYRQVSVLKLSTVGK